MVKDHIASRDELITVEEEVKLIKKIQQYPEDCEADKEKLLLANRRFVVRKAQIYIQSNDLNIPVEVLIKEGNKGILEAAMRFDETRGFKFISYAAWFIDKSLEQYASHANKR